jgi:hypothetical protein
LKTESRLEGRCGAGSLSGPGVVGAVSSDDFLTAVVLDKKDMES